MKLKKGDTVIIVRGKDKGKKGKIEKVFSKRNKVLIPNINVYKRHLKRRDEKTPGGIVDISRPIDVSNVAIICPKTKLPSRIGYRIVKDSKKRVTKKGDAVL